MNGAQPEPLAAHVARLRGRARNSLDHSTPVFFAADEGRADVLAALLAENPSQANTPNGAGNAPLHDAVRYPDCVRVLIDKGADVNNQAVQLALTPLLMAAEAGFTESVKLLLAAGAKPNTQNTLKHTPLYRAVQGKQPEIVALLLDAGADPALTDKDGYSPLMVAALHGDEASVRLLLDHKADINQKATDRSTALYDAALSGWDSIVRLLLSRGAEVTSRYAASTPLHAAGSAECVDLLLKAGADPTAKDREGKTPLERAASLSQFAAARVLLAAQSAKP